MWIYHTDNDVLQTIILYGYSKIIADEYVKVFLNEFEGYLECDGY